MRLPLKAPNFCFNGGFLRLSLHRKTLKFKTLCSSNSGLVSTQGKERDNEQKEEEEDDVEAARLFEKLRDAEKQRIEKQEEFENKANIQLERQLVMASEWSRTLLTLRGKLK